jgi:hypothetical protein
VTHLRRRLFKTQSAGSEALRELLQTMFVSEVVSAANDNDIWIVSPWISDIPLIDNRSGEFDSLNPEWGRRQIRLAELLVMLMMRGNPLVIVTRDAETNKPFLAAISAMAIEVSVVSQLRIVVRNELHTKGIVLSRSQVLGSMNFTHNGLEILDESIEFCIEPEEVAAMRNQFRYDYGNVRL